jgi:hypothetical protein
MKSYQMVTIVALLSLVACNKNNSPDFPTIVAFSPNTGAAGIPVIITGIHFDSVASHNIVDFNGIPAIIYKATDSVLEVFVPAGATTGKITVIVNGRGTKSTNDFVILSGTWVQKADMPDPNPPNGRGLGIGFSIGNKGFMGMGTDNGSDYDDLYAYDPSTDSWTKKSSLGIGLEQLVCMVINNKAYVGIGESRQLAANTNQFFEYDPQADSWTRKADFPGTLRRGAFGLAIGNMGYLGFGYDQGAAALNDFWQYDPASDTWIKKSNFPGNVIPASVFGFTLDNTTGYIGTIGNYDPLLTNFWQYLPTTDTWTQKNNFPGQGFYNPSSMVINGNGYVMGGIENWLYNPATDSWTQKAFFGERIGGSTFVIGGYGYFGLGSGIPGFQHSDLWRFSP